MGYIVICEDKEIWSPSLTAGRIFYEQVKQLETVIEEESGISNTFDDELEIEKRHFLKFLEKTLDYFETNNNEILATLISGCLEVCLYLYYIIEKVWITIPKRLNQVGIKAKNLANS